MMMVHKTQSYTLFGTPKEPTLPSPTPTLPTLKDVGNVNVGVDSCSLVCVEVE
jgi:hypothetical protein